MPTQCMIALNSKFVSLITSCIDEYLTTIRRRKELLASTDSLLNQKRTVQCDLAQDGKHYWEMRLKTGRHAEQMQPKMDVLCVSIERKRARGTVC